MPEAEHKYLTPADLSRLRHVRFAPRRRVEGLQAGRHASPQLGQSVEFADYRPYTPGDEVGRIDWKVYARTDRLYLRRFEQQSEMTVCLLLDASASMAYRGAELATRNTGRSPGHGFRGRAVDSKYDHAARLAAAICFLVTQQQDKAAFAVARRGLRHYHPPGGATGHLRAILGALERTTPGGEADLAAAVDRLLGRLPRRSVLVVLSDLLDEPAPVLRGLSAHAQRGGEVILFHVLHRDELELPPLDHAVFTDSESGRRLPLHVADIRAAYRLRLRRFLDTWAAACRGRGFDYHLIRTDRPYHTALEGYLFRRMGT